MTKPVETVNIGGIRYVVAVLREKDIQYLAQRIAAELRHATDQQTAAELDAEHSRQAPGFRHSDSRRTE